MFFLSPAHVNKRIRYPRIRTGKYSFGELYSWYHEHVIPAATRALGLSLLDIDERRNRIAVYVRDSSLIGAMRRALAALPIPPDAIDIGWMPQGSPQSGGSGRISARRSQSLSDHTRPLVAGLRIHGSTGGAPDSCTLGFNLVPRLGGALQAQRYLVTAGHCIGDLGNQQGGDVRQPSSPYSVATEASDPEYLITDDIYSEYYHPSCPENEYCRLSETVLAQYHYPSLPNHGRAAFPDEDETDYSYLITITDTEEPYQGQIVHKIGATTGRSEGEVSQSCVVYPYPGTN